MEELLDSLVLSCLPSAMFSSPVLYMLLTRGCDGVVVSKPAPAASGAPVRGAGSVDPCHSARTFCALVGENFLQIIFNIVTS